MVDKIVAVKLGVASLSIFAFILVCVALVKRGRSVRVKKVETLTMSELQACLKEKRARRGSVWAYYVTPRVLAEMEKKLNVKIGSTAASLGKSGEGIFFVVVGEGGKILKTDRLLLLTYDTVGGDAKPFIEALAENDGAMEVEE